MIIPFSLNNKIYEIKAYNTFQEKEILLLSSFDIFDLDRILDILEFHDRCGLSENEKKVIIYKHREISIGDEADIRFVCKNCGKASENTINLSNFIVEGKRNDDDILKFLTPFDEREIKKYLANDLDVDELDISDYELLMERIIHNQPYINFNKHADCLNCGHQHTFNVGENKYLIESLSEETLMTLYKSFNHLIFFGRYSKEDIDNMYPFERTIFIGLLNKTKEDLAK